MSKSFGNKKKKDLEVAQVNKGDAKHLRNTASLGCVVCRNLGYGPSPAQLHHIRAGQGVGQRASHRQVIPLCPAHHLATYPTGFHANPRGWQQEHGTELELLEQTRSDLEVLEENVI